MEIENDTFLQRPQPMRGLPAQKNKDKFCKFHRDHGHSTEECLQLKDAIEDIIRRGYLCKYVRPHRDQAGASNARNPSKEMELPNQRPTGGDVGMLHRWSGGSNEGGPNIAKRSRGSNAITFSDEDLLETHVFENDPVVVSAVIANYDVRRILIDNGSSTEVLLYDAFVRMNLSRSMLQESPALLTGFGGNSIAVEGEIVLPVTIGIEPFQKTLPINFVVVRTTSPYNAILGRPDS